MYLINIDREKCTGCGQCVDICPSGVFQMGDDDKTDPFNASECVGCMSCVESCPEQAIAITEM